MASLEYVMAPWLRSRRLTVASVGAGRGLAGFSPRPLPHQVGGLQPGDFLTGGGRPGRLSGGRPWLHSAGSFQMYLVPLWAFFWGVRRRMGWALLSSRLSPSGLSGALLPWSGSFWRCQVTQICTPVGAQFLKAVLDHPCGRCGKAVGLLGLFGTLGTFRAGLVLAVGERMMRMLGPGGAGGPAGRTRGWSGGAGGGAGGWEVVVLPSFLACWGLGADAPLFRRARCGGTRGAGAGGAWGWKKGCVACWPGSRSGGSAGVCMVALARLRVRSATLHTVSRGSVGHGSAAGLSSKGWWGW